ncbi:unnamed protein product [Cunninghamella blakesleeana]
MLQRAGNDAGTYQQTTGNQKNNSPTTDDAPNQFQEETLTLLHFFYIVRLAQQGFFTLISQSYPNVEPNALIYLCDKLVGGSLFAVKDPIDDIRTNKRSEVFSLLQKLHDGKDEPIDDQFTTTFKSIHHLISHFIHSTMTSQQPSSSSSSSINKNNEENKKDNMVNGQQQSPVWLVVPFTGMINNTANISNLPGLPSSSWQQSNFKPKLSSSSPSPHLSKESMTNNQPVKSYSIEVSSNINNTATTSVWKNQTKSTSFSSTDHTPEPSSLSSTPDILTHETPMTSTNTTITDHLDETEINKKENHSSLKSISEDKKDPSIDEHHVSEKPESNKDEKKDSSDPLKSTDDENTKVIVEEEKEKVESSSSWGTETETTTTITTGWGDEGWSKNTTTNEEKEEENSGWGAIEKKEEEPVWAGKLPDELINPGDETISGDVTNSNWQSVEFSSNKSHYNRHRGGGSSGGGFRRNGPSQRGGRGGYRANNDFRRDDRNRDDRRDDRGRDDRRDDRGRDDRRDDRGRDDRRDDRRGSDSRRGGMRRGGANSAWGKPLSRTTRSD